MNEFERIEEQVKDFRKRYSEVRHEWIDLKAQLETKRKEQGAAIVDSRDAAKLGQEIVSLQTQIGGAEEAQEQIRKTLRDLETDKARAFRAIARDQAENKKADILHIEADIYSLLVQAAMRLPDLHSSRVDYVSQLAAAGSQDARDEGHKITVLHETLRREISNLLDCFPRSVLNVGDLPSPSTVRAAMKRT